MVKEPIEHAHLGSYLREEVLPKALSVTDAAKRLGVGRPALSNLLNGKASLSSEMALRLERAFGADANVLLDIQRQFQIKESSTRGEDAKGVRPYVPPFLEIKARAIEQWADTLEARSRLAVLLRRLVHSTGRGFRAVDFPGFDNAERHGWDGFVEADAATAWIPEGKSGWEFGVTRDAARKAESDYTARLGSLSLETRKECTFVFVTPRRWPGKATWVAEKQSRGEWKAVRAYDSSDLEQWIEESVAAQIWLAEQIGISTAGFETLDQCWNRWAGASEPALTPSIFEPSVIAHGKALADWLENRPAEPFVVVADSKKEALAFLACAFDSVDGAKKQRDLVAVFESPETLRKLLSSSSPFIAIAATDEVEHELAGAFRRIPTIVVRPRNQVQSDPDIALDLLRYEDFEKAVTAMGIAGDQVERLARESGRSPTILRRRLSPIEAIRIPPWSRDAEAATSLISMALVGAWNAKTDADREVVGALAGRPYDEVEAGLARLRPLDESPVWSAGAYRGVASKIDSLFAVSHLVTERHLNDFFLVAEYVLSEADPALELPEDQRWAAGLYGKVRHHSPVLREGLCETLVILSVHGNHLFKERLGIDVARKVDELSMSLLTPLSLDRLMSQERDLPRYAEAAPDVFLQLLEEDLRSSEPVVLGLLRPVASPIFGHCSRTGLLWGLECLAWKPERLLRVCMILAELSRTTIEDNWVNKPINSLKSILRSWMPQTSASLGERKKTLERLCRLFPDVGWQVCMAQVQAMLRTATGNYRPRWRSDASGAGQVVSRQDDFVFVRFALDMALAWPHHDERTLGDLVERLVCMNETDQRQLWNLIASWAANGTLDDRKKAVLRERIRRHALARRGRRRAGGGGVIKSAQEAIAILESQDPVVRHAWLFANQWVELSAEEDDDGDLDFRQRQERIQSLRVKALEEIWREQGVGGIKALLDNTEAATAIGQALSVIFPSDDPALELLSALIELRPSLSQRVDACLQGFLAFLPDERRDRVLTALCSPRDVDTRLMIYKCAPFSQATWRLVDQDSQDVRRRYWQEVVPWWGTQHTDAELAELLDRLLEVRRPRAAFSCLHLDWDRLDTSRLKQLLHDVGTVGAEPSGTFQLNPSDLSAALESLQSRPGVGMEELARLELPFVAALEHTHHGIANIERQVAGAPLMFVQAVALVYKRKDEGLDPEEWRVDNPEVRSSIASAMYRLLQQLRRIPGTQDDGEIDVAKLLEWVQQVRQLGAEVARADMVDHHVGQLLSHAQPEEDGTWPCRAVCEVMEQVASAQLSEGFRIGVHNARGVVARGDGGDQERELAAKYRTWAQQLAFEFPYVAAVVASIAESYDREAEWHDSEARIERRIGH